MPTYELAVWLHGVGVAAVREARTRTLELRYTDAAIDAWGFGEPVLSVAMPLNPERRHPPGAVGPFLEGLLPEGEARTTLESRFDVRRGDTLALLKAIGRECAGAVVFQGIDTPAPPIRHDAPVPISHREVVASIANLASHPLGDDEHVRLSLAGQQEKLLLTRTRDGNWARPIGAIPSTHILKPEREGLEHLVSNEALSLRTARALKLTSIDVESFDADGRPVLVVSRYDRETLPDGQITRIHQEDLCQATSTPTLEKYEADGGPGFHDVAGILDRWAGSAADLEQLAGAMTLNVALGNADAHAKNFSLLHHPDGKVALAPLYDIASTVQYPTMVGREGPRQVSTKLAMRIASVDDVNAVTRNDLVAEASSWPIGIARARGAIDRVVELLPDALEHAAEETPDAPERLVERIARRVAALRDGRQVG